MEDLKEGIEIICREEFSYIGYRLGKYSEPVIIHTRVGDIVTITDETNPDGYYEADFEGILVKIYHTHIGFIWQIIQEKETSEEEEKESDILKAEGESYYLLLLNLYDRNTYDVGDNVKLIAALDQMIDRIAGDTAQDGLNPNHLVTLWELCET